MKNLNIGRIVFGLFFLLLGISIFLDQIVPGYNLDIFGRFWPLLVVAWGFGLLMRRPGRPVFPSILILFGLAMLVDGLVGVSFFSLWPLLLIGFGVMIISGSGGLGQARGGTLDQVSFFSSSKKRITDTDFRGGETNAIFGEVEVDLTRAKWKNRIHLEANAVFGSLHIRVGDNVRVINRGTAVLGSFSDTSNGSGDLELEVDGAAVFGEVKITN